MTPPILPTVSLGNVGTDISGAAAGFIKGLRGEQDRRRQMALDNALLRLKFLQATKGEPSDFRIVTEATPTGLKYARVNMLTGEKQPISDITAPMQQFFGVGETPEGNLTQYSIPRTQLPGSTPQATQVNLPPNQQPRDISPAVLPTETPTGPGFARVPRRHGGAEVVTTGDNQPVYPRAQQFEVDKAQFAGSMARSAHAMEKTAPADIEAVVGRQNIQSVLQSLPVMGQSAGEAARSLMALGLTPAQAKWLANFNTFVGFAVPELAGKQMTITEMRQNMAMFAPLLGEPEEGRAVKRSNVRFRVGAAIRASGSGWHRLMSDPTISSQIPTEYGGTFVDPTEQSNQQQSRYGYTRP